MQGLQGVLCYIDHIPVSGENEANHFKLLGEVLSQWKKHGFRLKQNKCRFRLPRVEYLGHQISSDGILPFQTKVEAIVKALVLEKNSTIKIIPGSYQLLWEVHTQLVNLAIAIKCIITGWNEVELIH